MLRKMSRWMERRARKKKQPVLFQDNEQDDTPVSVRLEDNDRALRLRFANCSDVMFRRVDVSPRNRALFVYIDGLVDVDLLGEQALHSILIERSREADPDRIMRENTGYLQLPSIEATDRLGIAINQILAGNVCLFMDGSGEALILKLLNAKRRSVEEPQNESLIRGPKEGFTENIRINTALLRLKIKSTRLKLEQMTVGSESRTIVNIAYLEGTCDARLIEEVRRRLEGIQVNGVLESGVIEEFIEDNKYSPFPQMQYTERPDIVAGLLLEGKFAVFVDGTPFVLCAPVTFWQMLQSAEDYYERYMIGTALRWLRLTFLFLALFLPGIYVAVTTYHHELMPTNLELSIAAAREAIPFPTLLEALMMEISFEALREASIRLPQTVGQAVSILGALVIGQAAVEAGIVSAPMVIIVSLTGIASFAIPRFNFSIAIRILRFPVLIMAGLFGLFGIIISALLISLHLTKLTSFGVPYLSGYAPFDWKSFKDLWIRAPWPVMRKQSGPDHRGKERAGDAHA